MNARRLIASLAIFAVVVGGIGITIAVLIGNKPPPPAASPRPQMPIPAEFQIGVVVTDQNCTEPTRCVYKYRIEPKYIGTHPLPEKEIKVVYQVTGGSPAASRRLHGLGRPGAHLGGCPRRSPRCASAGIRHADRRVIGSMYVWLQLALVIAASILLAVGTTGSRIAPSPVRLARSTTPACRPS